MTSACRPKRFPQHASTDRSWETPRPADQPFKGNCMRSQTKISLKHSMAGLFFSAIAAATVIFAMKTYAGPVPPIVLPCAVAMAVFLVMNRRLWRSVKESYDAGEVCRRVNQPGVGRTAGRQVDERSTWFAKDEGETTAAPVEAPQKNKKTLQAVGPEGLV